MTHWDTFFSEADHEEELTLFEEAYSQCHVMKNSKGPFSAGLLSLQLQLKTLLEESGGDHAAKLLDALCKLNKAEQGLISSLFLRTIEKLVTGGLRLSSLSEEQLKSFEECLYKDLLAAMNEAAENPISRRLEVLDGGKKTAEGTGKDPLDFSAALRTKKKHRSRPVLN